MKLKSKTYTRLTHLRDKNIPNFLVIIIDWIRYKYYLDDVCLKLNQDVIRDER